MISIITMILPMLLKLLGMYFSNKAATKEEKEAWANFLVGVSSQESGSVKVKKSVDSQLERLKNGEGS